MSTEAEATPGIAAAGQPGFGARLRAARDSSGRTQAEVADKLHCDVSVIVALENEDLATMGAAVYARGHLRRYAEYLNLPAPELVAQYELRKDHPGYAPDLTRIAQAERPRDPNRALRWVYVIVGGLFGLFVVWWALQAPRGQGSLLDVMMPTASAPAAAAPQARPPVAIPPAPVAVPPVAGASAVTPAPAAGQAGAAAAPAVPADTSVKLGFRARADCWVEVYDKDGRQLYFDLARRGARQDVAGAGPLRLVLGNAPAIRFELSGREFTVPEALQRKSTAFITIAADGRIEQAR